MKHLSIYRSYLIQLLVLLMILLFILPAQAQRRTFVRAADEAFEDERYSIAIEKYQKAYTKSKKNPAEKDRISFRLAECYRLTGDVKRAKGQYARLIRNGYENKEPVVLLHYADILKMEEDYEGAKENYAAYVEKKPDDARGTNGLVSIEKITGWIENPTKYDVKEEKKLNSRESDFAPTYLNENYNAIIFTSTREGTKGKTVDEWTDQNFSDLFTARLDVKGEWSTPVLLDDQESDGVNTEDNEGTPMMTSDFSTLYFTRCPNEDDKKNGCQIYTSRRTGRTWGTPMIVNITTDSSEAIGHPTMSRDETIIYFASNRPGGQGGNDIWVVFKESGDNDFRQPQNLGPVINTAGNEMFPFLRSDTVLYFASDGHPGLGGLDIFYTTPDEEGQWSEPVNMGTPVNSPGNDFAIIFHPTEERGFFSSDRNGRRSLDDIYSFIIPPVEYTLAGVVKDERTLQFVSGARVDIIGSDGVSMTARTNDKGVYMFGKSQIMANTTYEMTVSKENYFNTSGRVTTVGVERSKDLTRDFMLQPIPEEPIVLPEIQYDLDKWDLKPQFQDSLQGLITTLDENPFLVIELSSHTDARASFEYNDVLSQKRAQSVVDYLIERGIDPDRLVAKGYGERVPRKLNKDYSREDYTFPMGIILTETYIDSLPSNEIKEAAHQLNRRTEFRIISKDFIPKPKNVELAKTVNIILNPDDNVLPYKTIEKTGLITAPCIVNGYTMDFIFDAKLIAQISVEEAMKLLAKGAIGKEDFKGKPEEVILEGTIANRAIFNIKELTIANQTINDIEVMVNSNLAYPFVIGNSVMSKFGDYSIDTENKRIVFKKKQ